MSSVRRWWRKLFARDPCLNFSGGGRVRVRDLRYYLDSPKVQAQVKACREIFEGRK